MTRPEPTTVSVDEVGPEAAAAVLKTIHEAFAARPVLDPPATAMAETIESVTEALAGSGGLLATIDGEPVGALLLSPLETGALGLRRVSVLPAAQRQGVAVELAEAAEVWASRHRLRRMVLDARIELPGTVRFWQRMGYHEISRTGPTLHLSKELPVVVAAPDAPAMRGVAERLASVLQPGDVLLLTGELGAGKTTFTQGLGTGLGVRGAITSPTFVISRVHPSLNDGPALVHVDAYRLGGAAELDDLDLDVSLEDSVTVVEWGSGLAEALAEDRLEVSISRAVGSVTTPGQPLPGTTSYDEGRLVRLAGVGRRWVGSDLADVVA